MPLPHPVESDRTDVSNGAGRRRGFALLEASTALFIVVTGLFGAFQMFQYGVDKVRVTGEYAIAGRVIENELETLRAQPFDSLEAGSDRRFLSISPELDRLPAVRTHTAIRLDTALPSRLKEISIVVHWRTEHGRRAERRLTTLVARSGAE